MTVININNDLHKKVGEFIDKEDRIEYPSTKNFVDKAVKEKLDREVKKKWTSKKSPLQMKIVYY